ncbi:phage antirepressor KilAC domain-containing protein [Paraburkholderia sp. USG1]|uniref:phage antirepressor KilAC domain-containing protein n=1 Tax=Paraburkholderia sp. USG1 TaxID=2952268 RepID=UPI00285FA2C3|nr:phage antirepressor KilAC domain-containing protein [Paraburkholderia sp. USG1]MDR8400089.1 phage antirepressor KilAC domain-containing protein [Paraburkholderia sp. USG1]
MRAIANIGVSMSSREIAELVESRHDNVKRTMETLRDRGLISFTQSEETSHDGPGARRVVVYLVGKRDSYVIVAQLSPEFTARLVDRWQELEARAATPAFAIPQSLPDALRLAADLADERDQLKIEVQAAAPKVKALDRLTFADGAMCITDAAKTLQLQPKALFDWLSANQWIYRRPACATWTAYQDKIQRGVLEHKITTVNRADGSEKVTSRVLVTAKGLAELAQKLECHA